MAGCVSTGSSQQVTQAAQGSVMLLPIDPLGYATPGNRCEVEACTRLLQLIDNAQRTIDFAVYGMRNQTALLRALEAAQTRGVAIRGVVDRDRNGDTYYSSTDKWVTEIGTIRDDQQSDRIIAAGRQESDYEPPCDRPAGFEGPLQCLAYNLGDSWLLAEQASVDNFAAGGGPDGIMHDKFFIVDGRYVWTGSANISDSGVSGYNANLVALVDSKELARIYTDEFNLMYEQGLHHSQKPSNGVERLSIGGDDVTVWFSPQDDAMRYGVETLIAKAKRTIDVSVFFLTSKYVTADLIAAHQRGVDVRVIVDATSAGNGYTKHDLLRVAGVPVKVENWGGKMHMKAAVIDGEYLIVGSMNWTAAGENTNDENTLLIRSPKLASEFTGFFEELWGSIPEEWAGIGSRPDPESFDSSTACTDGIDNDFDNLVDKEDPGCEPNPPALAELPPYRIISKTQLASVPDTHRLYAPSTCEAAYTDWFVCVPPARYKTTCADLPYRTFTALPADPLGLDAAGDGIACETVP
jgi:phosphatidylserine/phosphatidylglycerophosphate/cardiolipin synthase-like enzyme